MATAKVIQLRPKQQLRVCTFKESCPVYAGTADVDDPVAAIYTIITQSGLVLSGAHKVKRRHVEDLLLALDRLNLRLQELVA